MSAAKKRTTTAKETAEICGVCDSLVRKTIRMKRNNDVVVQVYAYLDDLKNDAFKKAKDFYNELQQPTANA